MRKKNFYLVLFLFSGLLLSKTIAQPVMENLNRGIIAVRPNSSEVLVSWRILGNEYAKNATYNLYRNSTLIAEGLKVSNYKDNTSTNYSYSVAAVIDSIVQDTSVSVTPWSTFYKSIPLTIPDSGTTPSGGRYGYNAYDASVGDLDGDGDYEIVLKWDPSNSKDNSFSGYTGNVILDAYEMDGTLIWRIDLGVNIRAGAHYTQFIVYDLDSDGDAEIACKTAPGTIDGTGNYISTGPADSADHSADYRNTSGFIIKGPEYLTVFSGADGKEIQTVLYVPDRYPTNGWGLSSDNTNRVDRFLACVAYLDGIGPSLVMCRGYYGRSVLAAWDFRGDSLTHRWTFDSDIGYKTFDHQGNHNLAVGDVDGDGKDEIMYGSCAIDDDGSGVYTTKFGHGDAGHLTDINPDIPGLEYFSCKEGANGTTIPGLSLRSASDGTIQWSLKVNGDIGRCMAADIDPNHKGYEIWGSDGSGMYSCTGELICTTYVQTAGKGSSYNFGIWWDGDVLREMLDRTVITKWNYTGQYTDRVETLYNLDSISDNNDTKRNPCLMADIIGDWREEAIYRTYNNRRLVIFSTPVVTDQRMYTLMHDPVYRTSIAWQNVGYNQPPNLSFYFGTGMDTIPVPNIYFPGDTAIPERPVVVYIPPSSTQILNSTNILAYPNPVKDKLKVKDASGIVSIYNVMGNKILEAKIESDNMEFDLSDFPQGLYIIVVTSKNDIYKQTILKE